MKLLAIILLAGTFALATSAAFAQVRLGGHGSGGASGRGSISGLSANGSGRFGAGVRSHRGGAHLGVGGHSRRGFFGGIGNSRVNSAISGQSRGRGGARRR